MMQKGVEVPTLFESILAFTPSTTTDKSFCVDEFYPNC